MESGELAVTEPLKAELLQQLNELKQQIAIADDVYRRPILAELVALGVEQDLTNAEMLAQHDLSQAIIQKGQKIIEQRQEHQTIVQKEKQAQERLIEIIRQKNSTYFEYAEQIDDMINRVNNHKIFYSQAVAEIEVLFAEAGLE